MDMLIHVLRHGESAPLVEKAEDQEEQGPVTRAGASIHRETPSSLLVCWPCSEKILAEILQDLTTRFTISAAQGRFSAFSLNNEPLYPEQRFSQHHIYWPRGLPAW